MKIKLLVALLASSLWCGWAQGQDFNSSYNFVAKGTQGPGTSFANTQVSAFAISWNTSSTVATCALQVDSSADGITWGSADLIASQNCAVVGSVAATALAAGKNFVRINVTTLVGNGGLNVNLKGYASSGSSSSSPSLSIDATAAKYGLKYDAHWVLDATTTTGANPTVTCNNSSDCNFTSTDLLGRAIAKTTQVVFAICGPINFTNAFTATLDIAQTTITSINGAQSITVGGTGSTACANNLVLVWGDLDDGTLPANSSTTGLDGFWNDVASQCTRGLLPPGGMLVARGHFNRNGAGSCSFPGTTQSTFQGVDLVGPGMNSVFVIPVPNFDLTTGSGNSCGGGPTNNYCFLGATGITVVAMQIWGAGNPLTGVTSASPMYLAGISGGATSGNAFARELRVGNWGANGGANLRGLIIHNTASNGFYELVSDAFGSIACTVDGGLTNTEIEITGGSFCGDTGVLNQANAGTLLINAATVRSHGNNFGFCNAQNGTAAACSAVYVQSNSRFLSHGDQFDTGAGGGGGVGVAGVGTNIVITLDGALVNQQIPSTAASALYAHGGAIIKVDNSSLSNGNTSGSIFFIDDNLSKIYEGPNNTITSSNASATNLYNLVTGALTLADGHALTGACTGVATASQPTMGLFGTGPNITATTCTVITPGAGIVMTTSRSLMGLRVNATAAGVNGSSGLVTVLKNGAGTTLVCTLGTTTFCQDGQHSVSVVAGDLISIQFTTQAADTLAGVKAYVEWN